MGTDPETAERAFDEAEAFFAYIEDPDADLTTTLAVEEMYEVSA